MGLSRLSIPLVLVLLPALADAGAVLDRIRANGSLTIAHREAAPPFSYYDDRGQAVGYAVELCQRIAESVRRKLALRTLDVRYLSVSATTRIPAIVDGKADLECGVTTNNAERRKLVAFTVPHFITGTRYLVRAGSDVTELSGFAKRRLVSVKGTTPLKAITATNDDRMLGIDIVAMPDQYQAMDSVENGQAEGFAMDDVQLYSLAALRPDPSRFKVVGKFLTIEPLAIMLSKDDFEFKKLVDEEMKRLILSREAYVLYERWFMKPVPPKNTALNLPMSYFLKDFWKYPTDHVPF